MLPREVPEVIHRQLVALVILRADHKKDQADDLPEDPLEDTQTDHADNRKEDPQLEVI